LTKLWPFLGHAFWVLLVTKLFGGTAKKCDLSFGPLADGPETLPTRGTGCLSNIVEGLRLKMKIDEVMAILRFGPSIFR